MEPAEGPPRKKMRKGTKSCLECRKRKVRCIFEPGSSDHCKECRARGLQCVNQDHGRLLTAQPASDQAHGLKERVIYLEGLVTEALQRRVDGGPSASTTRSTASPDDSQADVLHESEELSPASLRETPLALPGRLREEAPALSLFDNGVIARSWVPPESSHQPRSKNSAVKQSLIALLPEPRELENALELASSWWDMWRPILLENDCPSFKAAFADSLESENPAELGKMMICITLSINQLPSERGSSQSHFEGPSQDLMERHMVKIDQLITRDDEIAGTIAGIECMILQAKHYANVGRPRKAWLVTQRSISYAQLLGIHRLVAMKPEQPDKQVERQLMLWTQMVLAERYLALFLGLPLSIQPRFCDSLIPAPERADQFPQSKLVMLRLSSIIARIVDRNQGSSLDLSTTFQIDEELDDFSRSISQDWWGKLDNDAPTFAERYHRLRCQLFFHVTRKVLHLPFMLKVPVDPRYQYSYAAALDSSREIIRFYNAIRQIGAAVSSPCKVVDFEAFCAAVLILIHLYGNSRGTAASPDQDQSDSALVDSTIENLGKASREVGGFVAEQSRKALEMIAEARHGCMREICNGQHSMKVSIPFFGTISLAPGSHFHPPQKGRFSRPALKSTSSSGDEPSAASPLTAPATAKEAAPQTTTIPESTGLPTPPSATTLSSNSSPRSTLRTDTNPIPAPASTSPSAYTTSHPMPYPPPPPYHHLPHNYHQHQHRHQQQQQTASNSVTNFYSDYPLFTFDSYAATPPCALSTMYFGTMDQQQQQHEQFHQQLHNENNKNANNSNLNDMILNPNHNSPALNDGTMTGPANDDVSDVAAAGTATTGAFTTPWLLDPGLDLDSSWNWTGFDGVSI